MRQERGKGMDMEGLCFNRGCCSTKRQFVESHLDPMGTLIEERKQGPLNVDKIVRELSDYDAWNLNEKQAEALREYLEYLNDHPEYGNRKG